MNLTQEDEARRAVRIADMQAHCWPLSQQEIADMTGVSRAHICNLFRAACWVEEDIYNKIMAIPIESYFFACPDVHLNSIAKCSAIVNDYEKAVKFLAKYDK